MEYVTVDKTGKIYLPKAVRSTLDTKSKYLVITLPDGDVVLHRIKSSKSPLKEFQTVWRHAKSLSKVRAEILGEAMRLVKKSGD
ncbi:MAG: AbrB/MazE/SpoVT family DNA-binding domain-containing protein [Candidatus Thermoplasmatota archaeon]|nr:AbrB/MazE/SpoVT family DNA-binding domain-containing protein [Candidatus Thermoplasmatota archaeon]